ncbi:MULTISPECIES: hypothetical protein [Wolbachia]|nr:MULTISPECIES: hypothetical protein [Wolbachia]MDX5497140.1 hypothetical protein [Wolbachia endosymbiont of Nomada fabriciana]MDX5507227.1 hypothetical protein [Wolbachia endosymbiont of Hylaeus sinuatus]MDX5528131.1 hypothetical protein [Wolbachia endosymbiont of Andrena minutula]
MNFVSSHQIFSVAMQQSHSSVKHWDLVDNVHTAATRMTPCACWL